MIQIDSEKEFKLIKNSLSVFKKISLQNIGFQQINESNLYMYQSDEYKVLNYSINPKLFFLINFEDNNVFIKLEKISIENLPNIFKTLKLSLIVNIFHEKNFYRINRQITLKFESKNKLIRYFSENFTNKFLNNLLEMISVRFDRKLIKKVSKII